MPPPQKITAMNMQSWSNQLLNVVNTWANIIGIVGAAFVLLSVVLIYLTTTEQSRRAEENEGIAKQQEATKAKRLEETEAKLEQAQASANEAIQRAKEIEEKSIPRVLTDQEQTQFMYALTGVPRGGVRIIAGSGDDETYAYALQIRKMFADAGFDTGPAPKIERWIVTNFPTISGIEVGTPSRDNVPPYCIPIINAFKAINIDAKPVLRPYKEYVVTIVVGKKL